MQRQLIQLLVFVSLGFSWAKAEYRVFELRIGPPDSQDFRIKLSQLDALQYRGYHHVPKGYVVEYIDTWMCKGRTSGKPFCPRPDRGTNDPGAMTRTPAQAAQKP
ncbi:MAG: hypothetical protein AB7O96_15235 [Pseudobdellovibrionaceae bacterium]